MTRPRLDYKVVEETVFDNETVVLAKRIKDPVDDLNYKLIRSRFMIFRVSSGNVTETQMANVMPDALKIYGSMIVKARMRQEASENHLGVTDLRVKELYMFIAKINGNEIKQYGRVVGGKPSKRQVRFIGDGRKQYQQYWENYPDTITVYHIGNQNVINSLTQQEQAEILADYAQNTQPNVLSRAMSVIAALGSWTGTFFYKEKSDVDTSQITPSLMKRTRTNHETSSSQNSDH